MLTVVHDQESSNEKNDGVGRSLLDGIVRDGARQMLTAALLAEVAAYVDAHAGEVDESGYRLVVRNGYHDERTVLTAAGAVAVKAPRVNDKRVDPQTGERQRFSSAILPAWARKSPQMTEVLPLLYLHGLSSGDFAPALEAFLGTGAGLSASAITRLTVQWQDEAGAFAERYRPRSTTCICGSTGSCATRRCVTERGCKTLAARLSWQRGEAGDSLTRGTPGRAASSPYNDETCWNCQTARARPARRKGVREKPACKAPQSTHQLQSGGYGLGCGAYRTALCRTGTPCWG